MLRDLDPLPCRSIIARLALDDRIKIANHGAADDTDKADTQALPGNRRRNPPVNDSIKHEHNGRNL